MLRRFIQEERGQGLAEYALILALVAVVAIAALTFLGGSVSNALNNVANGIDSGAGSGGGGGMP